MAYTKTGRVEKTGQCDTCGGAGVRVSWHLATRRWYCASCWPLPRGVVPASSVAAEASAQRFQAGVSSAAELLELRDRLYGIRLEDSIAHPMTVRLRCPLCGWPADGLTLRQGHQLQDAHRREHLERGTAPPTMFAPAEEPPEPELPQL